MTERLHLSSRHFTVLVSLLKEHLPGVEVWVYGSRVNGRSHDGSDLDLVLRGPSLTEIPTGQLADFEEAVGESSLPFLVEARDWARLPERFHGEIERDYVVLDAGKPDTTHIVEGAGDSTPQSPQKCGSPGIASEWSLFYTRDLIADDLLEIGDGYRAKNSEMGDSGLPFVRAGDVNGRVNTVGTDILAVESLSKVGAKRSNPGDVVITTKGTVGRMAFVADGDPEFIYSPQLCYWRSKDKGAIYPRWLFYALQSNELKHQRGWSAAQTDMAPYISLTDQRDAFYLTIPPINEQRAIAHILGVLDDKIEVNRRMNATLEAMVRTVFKDWFMDFGPTRAKMEGYEPYLAPEIWDLFPDRLDDEGKPEGWLARPVNDLFEFNPRESIEKGTDAPYLDMAALPMIGPIPDAPTKRGYKSGSKFRDGDTLFARITPCLENGKTAYIFDLGDDVVGAGSTEFIVIRSRTPLPQPASYFLARESRFRIHAERSMTGTSGRQRANAKTLSQYEIIAPTTDHLWRVLGDLTNPLMDKMIANARESRILAQIRDLFLPKLLLGEIRLCDAVKAVKWLDDA